MSLLLPDAGLLFWMVLTFGIVWVVLGKFGFPVITKMVEGRKSYIDQSLAVAKEANEQIAKLKEENAVLIANAGKEQGRIIKEAMQERDKIIAQAQVQARAAAQKEVDEAKERIRQEQEEAVRAVRRQVAALSVDIAEKVIRKQLDGGDEQMAMIDRMLDDALKAAKANSN
ncbi:MAG: F0F1 ATP synthase subunit B [Prevotellaceae bacterium]|jgi:F-type H+-transporting ATPase subunit b|nr:F0F1 ATP synthase subunit B [Prevotellaceae bacterium]